MKIYRRQFEHVTIYGVSGERPAALDWIYKNGFDVRVMGPRPIKCMVFDSGQFQIKAQKQINKKVKRITKAVL